MGLDQAAIEKLRTRARREVDDGLLPSCQFALGYQGELVLSARSSALAHSFDQATKLTAAEEEGSA